MSETAAARLFLAHEEALEHAATRIYQALVQETKLSPAEAFVVCLRAAAKFLIQYDKSEWRDMIKHASELLLQYAIIYKKNSDGKVCTNTHCGNYTSAPVRLTAY